jgi:hypothetical protein
MVMTRIYTNYNINIIHIYDNGNTIINMHKSLRNKFRNFTHRELLYNGRYSPGNQ